MMKMRNAFVLALAFAGPASLAQPSAAPAQMAAARAETFNVYFDPGSAALTPEGAAVVASLARLIGARPYRGVVLTGHTDRQHGRRHSLALSQLMAETVRERLVALGIDNARIVSSGRGFSEPADPTRKRKREARDRRVEVRILR